MKRIRVAMLTQVYFPFVGGAEKQLARVLRRLPAHGIEAMVITRRHDDSPTHDIVENTPVHRVTVGKSRELASVTYTAEAIRALHRFRPDIVHAHELRSPSTTAVAYKALTGTPVLAKVLRGGSLGDIAVLSRKPTDRLRLSIMLRAIDAFAVISKEIDTELEAAGVAAGRRNIIPNGVDLDQFRPASADERRAIRARLGLPDAPIALFAGRLEHEKRIDDLVRLWPQVRDRLPGAVLAVVGTGSLESALRDMAGPGVVLAGKQQDMRSWYGAADSFVLPSEAEGLSNAMLEAMAMGLHCVATSVGAAPDLLGEGLGTLVTVDDTAALASAIVGSLAERDALRARLADPLREIVRSSYSLDMTAQKLADVYRELVEHRARRR